MAEGITDMKNRENFSKSIFRLHNQVNKMLKKKKKITYNQVKNKFEHFRARCNLNNEDYDITKENGCINPLYGNKYKCQLFITN